MKSQTQHIGNYSNVFDYSPFGVPLDGRTVENIFHQEEFTDTIVKTIYVLEETFDVASDWQAINSHTEITYPSGWMDRYALPIVTIGTGVYGVAGGANKVIKRIGIGNDAHGVINEIIESVKEVDTSN